MKRFNKTQQHQGNYEKKVFRKNFTKTVYGYFEVKARNKKEAQKKLEAGNDEEFDNKSDYITDEWECEEEEKLNNETMKELTGETDEEYNKGIKKEETGLYPDGNLRKTAIEIISEFEDLLDEKNITIPSTGREGSKEEARLYGSEYYAIEDKIVEILKKHKPKNRETG